MLFRPSRSASVATTQSHDHPTFGTLSWKMTTMLCCPSCLGDLEAKGVRVNDRGLEQGVLICRTPACRTIFPVNGGIPDLVPAHLLDTAQWQEWEAHLEQFQKRRTLRIDESERLASRLHVKKRGLQQAFATFAGITRGTVLDVGCGPGKLRFHLDPGQVEYYGIDPMPLPEARAFPFARAVAEFIPFRDCKFTDVMVVSALDHFRDCAAFFKEVSRILEPRGKLHIVQSVHDAGRPLKLATHWLKDAIEDHATRRDDRAAPHHMHEFTHSSFLERVSPWFTVVQQAHYSAHWYSPDKLFITLARRA